MERIDSIFRDGEVEVELLGMGMLEDLEGRVAIATMPGQFFPGSGGGESRLLGLEIYLNKPISTRELG